MCEGQYNQSIQYLPLSWRRSVKSCQSPLERAGKCVLPAEPDWPEQDGTGAGLDPAGCQPRCTRGCPAERPLPGPTVHCEARHSERRVSARQVRPGPSQSSFVPFWGRSNPWSAAPLSLPVSCYGPDPRRWDYRPTYPGRELSSWRGSGSRRSRGALEGWDCWDFVLFNLRDHWGRANGGCPSADLPGYLAAWAGGRGGRDSRSELPAVKRYSLAPRCQKHGGPPRLFRWPRELDMALPIFF